jgi:hypothetical protein
LDLKTILQPYNPWIVEGPDAFRDLPDFHRPIFETLWGDLERIPQMLSITGPRRIGKSTLLHQLIKRLFDNGVDPDRLVYYSFDDPILALPRTDVANFFATLMQMAKDRSDVATTYFFFDEIQRLENWELYLKKYYDLKYPIKVVISGSASSPIFKKSRESLLGRVKDYHLLPFSFREFVLYRLKESKLSASIQTISGFGGEIRMGFAAPPLELKTKLPKILAESEFREFLDSALSTYFFNGGFPETWQFENPTDRLDYLYDNHVKKVIYEDLVLAAEFRKPEMLKQFYVSLLEKPGTEVSMKSLSNEIGISSQQIEKYFPLLEMTDLVYRLPKFRKSPVRVRSGSFKCYLVDLALRNAVLRVPENVFQDNSIQGLYAENLVFLALRKWEGILQLDYYREKNVEVDFIVHTSPGAFLPVEVKYRNSITAIDFNPAKSFLNRFGKRENRFALMVTKKWDDLKMNEEQYTLMIPLPLFLLMFD